MSSASMPERGWTSLPSGHGDAVLTDSEGEQIDEKVRPAAYHIIAGTEATYCHRLA
ncbi:MAG: hypothetical protein JO077_20210 [Verrucomicrobia bacterium]|nr:hypothetical protein [Verrucomicrobiota bacterium]